MSYKKQKQRKQNSFTVNKLYNSRNCYFFDKIYPQYTKMSLERSLQNRFLPIFGTSSKPGSHPGTGKFRSKVSLLYLSNRVQL